MLSPLFDFIRSRFLRLAVVTLLLGRVIGADGFAGTSWRVATWNLEWFPEGRPKLSAAAVNDRIRRAGALLGRVQPDILLVQEIRDTEALEQLCREAGDLVPVLVSDLPGGQELGIAARWQPLATWWERWRLAEGDGPPRGFAFAAFELPANRVLLVYNVHLKSNYGDADRNRRLREDAVRQLLEHADKMAVSFPRHVLAGIVIGGDFNTSIDGSESWTDEKTLPLLLNAGYHQAGEGMDLVTVPARAGFPAASFDHLFVRGASASRAEVTVAGTLSDHNLVSCCIVVGE